MRNAHRSRNAQCQDWVRRLGYSNCFYLFSFLSPFLVILKTKLPTSIRNRLQTKYRVCASLLYYWRRQFVPKKVRARRPPTLNMSAVSLASCGKRDKVAIGPAIQIIEDPRKFSEKAHGLGHRFRVVTGPHLLFL